jgi:hypothetical protein
MFKDFIDKILFKNIKKYNCSKIEISFIKLRYIIDKRIKKTRVQSTIIIALHCKQKKVQ